VRAVGREPKDAPAWMEVDRIGNADVVAVPDGDWSELPSRR
jgi:hypothetical protein